MSNKNENPVKDKLVLPLLAAGICCFGLILPDSLSDHDKLVHFTAHFGMSFLLALCFYLICTIKIRISKSLSYTVLIATTLIIGVMYKLWEISTVGNFERWGFSAALKFGGVWTSMSQNISGLLAAILLIEGLVDRNLSISALRPADYYTGPGSFQRFTLSKQQPGSVHGPLPDIELRPGTQFPPEAAEHEFR